MNARTPEFAREVHALSRAKGWYDDRQADETTRAGMLALIHSELSEALECIRDGDTAARTYVEGAKPEGLGAELADVVIRCLDYAVYWGEDVLNYNAVCDGKDGCTPAEAAMFICAMHNATAMHKLDRVVWACYVLAARGYAIDLDAAIAAKHAYNATRPHRHGNKTL